MALLSKLTALFRRTRPSGALTARELGRADCLGVYLVYAHDEDKMWPHSYLKVVAAGLTAEEAREAAGRLPPQPEWTGFRILGPRPLRHYLRDLGVEEARALLDRAGAGAPHEALEPPLTESELAQAARHQVYCLYYTERYGTDRGQSRAEALCLSREEAEAEAGRQGLLLNTEKDGCEITGPSRLDLRAPRVVREVLRRIAAGEPGPVRVPADY